ncbi:hypothetical protein QR98_0049180 [Sarcoptes scabiei]|uniref:Uncharacterized protein n=1 Tax=Sarcoptes scabiei TaxID=52283 RepID=A0A132A656_SARSC|nr:hypothetical protein QR98_0049180 [Sarcoptes scabiei]
MVASVAILFVSFEEKRIFFKIFISFVIKKFTKRAKWYWKEIDHDLDSQQKHQCRQQQYKIIINLDGFGDFVIAFGEISLNIESSSTIAIINISIAATFFDAFPYEIKRFQS